MSFFINRDPSRYCALFVWALICWPAGAKVYAITTHLTFVTFTVLLWHHLNLCPRVLQSVVRTSHKWQILMVDLVPSTNQTFHIPAVSSWRRSWGSEWSGTAGWRGLPSPEILLPSAPATAERDGRYLLFCCVFISSWDWSPPVVSRCGQSITLVSLDWSVKNLGDRGDRGGQEAERLWRWRTKREHPTSLHFTAKTKAIIELDNRRGYKNTWYLWVWTEYVPVDGSVVLIITMITWIMVHSCVDLLMSSVKIF